MEIKLKKRKLEEREQFYGRTVYDVFAIARPGAKPKRVGYVEGMDARRESSRSFANRSRIITGWTTDRDWMPYALKEPDAKVGYGLNRHEGYWTEDGKAFFTQETVSISPMRHSTRRDAVEVIERWVKAGKPWKEAGR